VLDHPRLGIVQGCPRGRTEDRGGVEDLHGCGQGNAGGAGQETGHLGIETRDVEAAFCRAQLGGVLPEDAEERRPQGGPATQSQDDGRCLGPSHIRQPRLEVARPGEEETPVYVEDRHLVAGQGGRGGLLSEVLVVGRNELDHGKVHGLLVEQQQ
jgi:hypothetical protein